MPTSFMFIFPTPCLHMGETFTFTESRVWANQIVFWADLSRTNTKPSFPYLSVSVAEEDCQIVAALVSGMVQHCPLSGLINQNRNMFQWHEIMFSAVRVKGFRRMTKDIWARQKCYSISNCISPLFGEIWNKIVQIKSSAAAVADPEILLGPIETHG